jgi:hypothetical protein
MTKIYSTVLLLLLGLTANAQETYQGNGKAGFGGFFGNSSLTVADDGTNISFTLTSQNNGFNDGFVFYFDTGAAGRNVIDTNVEDSGDNGRRAITNADDQGNGSIVTFPTDFNASHAVHMDPSFAGLFQIPSTGTVGQNELVFITNASGTYDGTSVVNFTFSFADLGLTSTDSFKFVGIYGNSGNAFTSNEGYGLSSSTADNIGGNDFSFETALTYGSTASLTDQLKSNLNVFYNQGLHFKGYNGKASIEVYNTLGQKVVEMNDQDLYDGLVLPISLPVSNLYIVRTSTADSSVSRKIIVR